MPDKVTYYAVVNDLSSRERPAGLFRRTFTEKGGLRDEAFTRNLVWKSSSSLISAERGDLQNDFIEITEDEANQLTDQLRARWTGPREERTPLRESGVIDVTGTRADALARLDVFIGNWVVEAQFPGRQPTPSGAAGDGPVARSSFEWVLDRQFLLQRIEIPVPEAPDGLSIVSADLETGAYTQHYFDSRGVVRLYAMTLADGVWTLTRESPDFTPLEFRQRFTGTFSQDGNTITGAWETGRDDGQWEHDFALIYRRTG